MSTRCVINFTHGDDVHAKVYRHSDGYPDGEHGVPAGLDRFFADVERQTKDTRFDDPSYLAAKFVVWQADQCNMHYNPRATTAAKAWKKGAILDFIGVGVTMEDPGDIDYRYFVNCNTDGRPSVRCEPID